MKRILKTGAILVGIMFFGVAVFLVLNKFDQDLLPEIETAMSAARGDVGPRAAEGYYYWLGFAHEDPASKGREFDALFKEAREEREKNPEELKKKIATSGWQKSLNPKTPLGRAEIEKIERLFMIGDYEEVSPLGILTMSRNAQFQLIIEYFGWIQERALKGEIKNPLERYLRAAVFLKAVVEGRAEALMKISAVHALEKCANKVAELLHAKEEMRKLVTPDLLAALRLEGDVLTLLKDQRVVEAGVLRAGLADVSKDLEKYARLAGRNSLAWRFRLAMARHGSQPNKTMNIYWNAWSREGLEKLERYAASPWRLIDNPGGAVALTFINPKKYIERTESSLLGLEKSVREIEALQ